MSCHDFELRSRGSRRRQSTFPRLAFDLSTFQALPFERAVLLLILVSDLNNGAGTFRTISSTIQKRLEGTVPQQLGIR